MSKTMRDDLILLVIGAWFGSRNGFGGGIAWAASAYLVGYLLAYSTKKRP